MIVDAGYGDRKLLPRCMIRFPLCEVESGNGPFLIEADGSMNADVYRPFTKRERCCCD